MLLPFDGLCHGEFEKVRKRAKEQRLKKRQKLVSEQERDARETKYKSRISNSPMFSLVVSVLVARPCERDKFLPGFPKEENLSHPPQLYPT